MVLVEKRKEKSRKLQVVHLSLLCRLTGELRKAFLLSLKTQTSVHSLICPTDPWALLEKELPPSFPSILSNTLRFRSLTQFVYCVRSIKKTFWRLFYSPSTTVAKTVFSPIELPWFLCAKAGGHMCMSLFLHSCGGSTTSFVAKDWILVPRPLIIFENPVPQRDSVRKWSLWG